MKTWTSPSREVWLPLAVVSMTGLGIVACDNGEELNPAPIDDAGAQVDASAVRCEDLSDASPWEDSLGQRTLAERGELLRCAHVGTMTQAGVSFNPAYPLAMGEAKSGAELFVIQYVSEGQPGEPRAVTALVYFPTGSATDIAIVATGHGMFGMGPSCGPSHIPSLIEPLAIPLVGRGYAVIAPDYAGVGVDNGMTSFLVGASEAAATLDGLRALRQIADSRFDTSRLGSDFFAVGWSQGGHAALFTHQLFDSNSGVRLLGSIAFAPGLGSAQAWATNFQDGARPVGINETFAAAALYAFMQHSGAPEPSAWLTPSALKLLPKILHDECLPGLLAGVPGAFPTVGDIYQPSFVAAAASCKFEKGCPGFEPWASKITGNEPGRFTSPVPSLILQGLVDVYAPADTVACTVDRLRAYGTPVQACGYAGIDHVGVVPTAVPEMLHWIEARRAGVTPDVCPNPLDVGCAVP